MEGRHSEHQWPQMVRRSLRSPSARLKTTAWSSITRMCSSHSTVIASRQMLLHHMRVLQTRLMVLVRMTRAQRLSKHQVAAQHLMLMVAATSSRQMCRQCGAAHSHSTVQHVTQPVSLAARERLLQHRAHLCGRQCLWRSTRSAQKLLAQALRSCTASTAVVRLPQPRPLRAMLPAVRAGAPNDRAGHTATTPIRPRARTEALSTLRPRWRC